MLNWIGIQFLDLGALNIIGSYLQSHGNCVKCLAQDAEVGVRYRVRWYRSRSKIMADDTQIIDDQS